MRGPRKLLHVFRLQDKQEGKSDQNRLGVARGDHRKTTQVPPETSEDRPRAGISLPNIVKSGDLKRAAERLSHEAKFQQGIPEQFKGTASDSVQALDQEK